MTEAEPKSDRETRQLFDLMFKHLLQESSSGAAVHFINGLFGKNYDPASAVSFRKTEEVWKQGEKFTKTQGDIILSITAADEEAGDDYAVEFQINDDEAIGLRIFEYGFKYARETKQIIEHGKIIEMYLPEGCVIYWENTGITPDGICVRLRSKKDKTKYYEYEVTVFKMAEQSLDALEAKELLLLLPFCLLRFRKELKKPGISTGQREDLASEEKRLFEALDEALRRGQDTGIISSSDGMMIMEHIALMHDELYNPYPEFKEARMVLEERVKSKWKAHERELIAQWKAQEDQLIAQKQEAVKQTEAKVIGLFKQGYTPEEVERLLAQEAKSRNAPSPDTQ